MHILIFIFQIKKRTLQRKKWPKRCKERRTQRIAIREEKFFRHRKKYSSRENSENEDKRKIVVPEHEFEEKFNVKPPPKNLNGTGESQQFNNWFFRDTNDDLDAMESYQSHNEVNK